MKMKYSIKILVTILLIKYSSAIRKGKVVDDDSFSYTVPLHLIKNSENPSDYQYSTGIWIHRDVILTSKIFYDRENKKRNVFDFETIIAHIGARTFRDRTVSRYIQKVKEVGGCPDLVLIKMYNQECNVNCIQLPEMEYQGNRFIFSGFGEDTGNDRRLRYRNLATDQHNTNTFDGVMVDKRYKTAKKDSGLHRTDFGGPLVYRDAGVGPPVLYGVAIPKENIHLFDASQYTGGPFKNVRRCMAGIRLLLSDETFMNYEVKRINQ